MTEQARIIDLLKAADITKDDWYWGILESNADLYARGYLSAYRQYACGDTPTQDEEYRELLIKACSWSIWGKS